MVGSEVWDDRRNFYKTLVFEAEFMGKHWSSYSFLFERVAICQKSSIVCDPLLCVLNFHFRFVVLWWFTFQFNMGWGHGILSNLCFPCWFEIVITAC